MPYGKRPYRPHLLRDKILQGLAEAVKDYCGSEHFLFLSAGLKEHAESMLSFWCDDIREPFSPESLNASLTRVGKLDLPADVRIAFPELLREFLEFAASTGRAPGVAGWPDLIDEVEAGYAGRFREDGSIRGETFRKKLADVGRNDPCPCGSGRKFKKCCIQLLKE